MGVLTLQQYCKVQTPTSAQTDAEDITWGQKRHTRNSVKLNYLSGCSLCMQRTDATSWVATNVNTSYLSGGQCLEDEGRHHGALSNTEAEDILCMQRKQCQLLARHLDERIFHSNALKGVVISYRFHASRVSPIPSFLNSHFLGCRLLLARQHNQDE